MIDIVQVVNFLAFERGGNVEMSDPGHFPIESCRTCLLQASMGKCLGLSMLIGSTVGVASAALKVTFFVHEG